MWMGFVNVLGLNDNFVFPRIVDEQIMIYFRRWIPA